MSATLYPTDIQTRAERDIDEALRIKLAVAVALKRDHASRQENAYRATLLDSALTEIIAAHDECEEAGFDSQSLNELGAAIGAAIQLRRKLAGRA